VGAGAYLGIRPIFYPHTNQSAAEKTLLIPTEELQLGQVYETPAYQHEFSIRNTGDRRLTIATFRSSCDCLRIEPDAEVPFLPNETKSFSMKLKLLAKGFMSEESLRIPIAAVFSHEGEPATVARWEIRGVLIPTIKVRPSILRIGTHSDRAPLLECQLDVDIGAAVKTVQCAENAYWHARIAERTDPSGRKAFRIVLQSAGTLSPRSISDTLELIPIAPSGERFPAKSVTIEGEILHDIVASPAEIQFGPRQCMTAAVEPVALRSLTNRPFSITSVSTKTKSLRIIPVSSDPNGHIYSLQMQFESPSKQSALAEFEVQDDQGARYSVPVPVHYCGVRPAE
jgi:hypothetical protein